MSNDNPSTALPGESGGTSTDGQENASQDVEQLSSILAKATGRNFQSDEDAIKAVKDTFDYVGKVGKYKTQIEKLESKHGGEKGLISFMENSIKEQQPAAATQQDLGFVSKEQYETDNFFSKNPLYAEHRTLIESVSKATGKSLTEALELPALKTVFDKVKGFDENQKSKSILHTNPRLGAAVDRMTSANDAMKKGNINAASSLATKAVMEAFEQ